MNRRSWLRTAAGLLVAPYVVRAESLMPVRRLVTTDYFVEVFGPEGRVARQFIDPFVAGEAHLFMPEPCTPYRVRMVDSSGLRLWLRNGAGSEIVYGNHVRVSWEAPPGA